MTDWIETAKELPPCDGFYEVKYVTGMDLVFNSFYDGRFFRNTLTYDPVLDVEIWRHREQPQKRYGKVNDEGY